MQFKENHWYKFYSPKSECDFKSNRFTDKASCVLISSNKYFKVKNIDKFGNVLDIEFPDGKKYPGRQNKIVLLKDSLQYFKEADYRWIKNSSYVLVDKKGFEKFSKINKRFISDVGTNRFTVDSVDIFDITDPLRSRTTSIRDSKNNCINFTLTEPELRFFSKVDNSTGDIIENFSNIEIKPISVENDTLINIIDGTINISVDDEASRLFAIKALEGIRFATV